MKRLTLLVLLAASGLAQTISITSPTSAQVIQSPTFTFTVSLASAPGTYRVCYLINDRTPVPENCSYQAPWSLNWYPYLIMDGQATIQATAYDVFGAQIVQSAKVTFRIRVTGLPDHLTGVPTTGNSGSVVTFLDSPRPRGGDLYIDGLPVNVSGVTTLCSGVVTNFAIGPEYDSFPTYCYINGPHEILVGGAPASLADPFNPANTFTSGSVSGSNITLNQPHVHNLVDTRPVTFTTSGTLPACSNCTGGTLKTGKMWTWISSASNANTVSQVVVTSGTAVATLSSDPASPSWINVYDIFKYDPATNAALCSGKFTVSSSNSTTVTWSMPTCPDGTYTAAGNPGLEVDTNPYYAIYVDDSTAQFSETPGGTALAFTGGGTGTHTANYRLRSGWWWNLGANTSTIPLDSLNGLFQWGYSRQQVTFSNGSHSMEIRPPYKELHLVAGASVVSICPKIFNTDLSTTTISCSSVTYTPVDDGGYSGVVTVDANGVVTPVNPGWSQITVACATCNAGGALTSVVVYAEVQAGALKYVHFGRNGVLQNTYNPGVSFFPHSMWHLELRYATADVSAANSRTMWLGPMMNQAGINVAQAAVNDFLDPANNTTVCPTFPVLRDTQIRPYAAQYGLAFEYEVSNLNVSSREMWALQHNNTFDRQTCFRNQILDIQGATTAPTYSVFPTDELDGIVGGTAAIRNGLIGNGMLTSISFDSNGLATLTGDFYHYGNVWNPATGVGLIIKLSGSNDSRLNNVFPVLSIPSTAGTGNIGTLTFQTTCNSCSTHTAGNDPALLLDHFPFLNPFTILPASVHVNTNVNQAWSSAFTQITSDHATPSVLTITCTACGWTGNGVNGSDILHIQSATNTGLNTVSYVTRIDANTLTVVAQGQVLGGPFNSSTDPSLILWRNSDLSTSYWAMTKSLLSGTVYRPGILGTSYSNLNKVSSWEGDARLIPGGSPAGDATLNYNPGGGALVYGEDSSVSTIISAYVGSNLTSRAYQWPARTALYGVGPQIKRFCRGFNFDPGCDHPLILTWRPQTMVGAIINAVTLGERGFRAYNFLVDRITQYNFLPDLNPCPCPGGSSIAPDIIPHQWKAMAHIFQLLHRLPKYHLQPQMNLPYLGPMFSTDAHTSSYGNELLILCKMDGGASYQQTVDLTSIRIASGTMYRASLTAYRLTFTSLPTNPTSDTYNFCAADAGETVVYIAQPPGVASDLDNMSFTPPATLPFGATKMAVRVGYFPGTASNQGMNDNPAVDCTASCTIPVNHYNMDAWYQTFYLNSSNSVLGVSDPQKIPSQGL